MSEQLDHPQIQSIKERQVWREIPPYAAQFPLTNERYVQIVHKAIEKNVLDYITGEIADGNIHKIPGANEVLTPVWHYVLQKATENARNRQGKYMWITINPKPNLPFEDLQTRVRHLCRLKPVKDKWAIYTYEQRGNPGQVPYGFHVHLLLHRGKSAPSAVIATLKRIFRPICQVDDPHILYVKTFYIDVALEKIDYLKGIKREEKSDKVTADNVWRTDIGLKPYYVEGTVPPLLLDGTQGTVVPDQGGRGKAEDDAEGGSSAAD